MMERPEWCPEDVWAATEARAKDRADWLVDAVATSTQNEAFLRGEAEEDTWATESIFLNGEKAIRIASARAILAERERTVRWLEKHHTIIRGEPADPMMPQLIAAIRNGEPT